MCREERAQSMVRAVKLQGEQLQRRGVKALHAWRDIATGPQVGVLGLRVAPLNCRLVRTRSALHLESHREDLRRITFVEFAQVLFST